MNWHATIPGMLKNDYGKGKSIINRCCDLLIVVVYVYMYTYRAFNGHRGLNKYSGIGITMTRNETAKTAVNFA